MTNPSPESDPAADPGGSGTGVVAALRGSAAGDARQTEFLSTCIYDELRAIAQRVPGRDDVADLQPTVLVHEAFLKIVGSDDVDVRSRSHFFAIAGRVMRQISIDEYRRRGAAKRGGDWARVTLSGVALGTGGGALDVLELEDALAELRQLDEREAHVVELRFFAGLSNAEIADELGISVTTVEADWRHARAWLAKRLEGSAS